MENHSAAVKIVSWFLAIVSVGAVATCLLVSRHLLRKKWLSFALLFGALVLLSLMCEIELEEHLF